MPVAAWRDLVAACRDIYYTKYPHERIAFLRDTLIGLSAVRNQDRGFWSPVSTAVQVLLGNATSVRQAQAMVGDVADTRTPFDPQEAVSVTADELADLAYRCIVQHSLYRDSRLSGSVSVRPSPRVTRVCHMTTSPSTRHRYWRVHYLIAKGKNGFTATGNMAANGFGEHSPGGYSMWAVIVAEIVLTGVFLLVILGSTDDRAPKGFAGLAIGLTLTLIHLISIPISNTSVNPARSTGVAFFNGNGAPAQLWVFLAGTAHRRGHRRNRLPLSVRQTRGTRRPPRP